MIPPESDLGPSILTLIDLCDPAVLQKSVGLRDLYIGVTGKITGKLSGKLGDLGFHQSVGASNLCAAGRWYTSVWN